MLHPLDCQRDASAIRILDDEGNPVELAVNGRRTRDFTEFDLFTLEQVVKGALHDESKPD